MKYNSAYAFPVSPPQVLPTVNNYRFLTFPFKCSTCKRLMLNIHRRHFLYGRTSFIKAPVLLSMQTLAMKSIGFLNLIWMLYYIQSNKLRHSCIKWYSTRVQNANLAGTASKIRYWDVKYGKNNVNLICPRKWLKTRTDRGEDIQAAKI